MLDGHALNPGDLSWQPLEALGQVTVYERTPEELVEERMADAEAAFTNKTAISGKQISIAKNLRFIGVLATGYNVVDVNAARERGIPVCNVPAYGTAAVAQFTIAMLLELCHHIGEHSDSVRRGDWSKSKDWCYWNSPLVELAGKTMGIIGFGRIGQATAGIASALGMRVIANSPSQSAGNYPAVSFVSLEALLAQSDVVSLHCPLRPETKGLIRKETIALMKDGALLLNSSRGALVVESDLCEALASGKLAGAALDVVSTEPIEADNPLLKARNCLITPHIAWAPRESRQRLLNIAVENLAAFLRGETQNNVWERDMFRHVDQTDPLKQERQRSN